jgi:hypothetical protein
MTTQAVTMSPAELRGPPMQNGPEHTAADRQRAPARVRSPRSGKDAPPPQRLGVGRHGLARASSALPLPWPASRGGRTVMHGAVARGGPERRPALTTPARGARRQSQAGMKERPDGTNKGTAPTRSQR